MPDLTSRFKLEAQIGKGGFGVVWRAQDLELRRTVAIKLMEPGGSGGSPISGALEHAQALARVNHPNVVRIYDIGTLAHPSTGDSWNAIVMELLDGPNLAELLTGELSNEQAVALSRGLLDGIEALHQSGIAHSDFHDENIMMHGGVPKILDVLYRGTLDGVPQAQRQLLLGTDVKRLRRIISDILVHISMADSDTLFRQLSTDAEDVASVRVAFEQAIHGAQLPAPELASSPVAVAPRSDKHAPSRHAFDGFVQLGAQFTDAALWNSQMPRRISLPSRDTAWASRVLAPGTLPRPRANNPATFLNARYAAVPFHAWLRDGELTRLRAWCEDESRVAVTVVAGPGGVGKTRVVLTLCDWARTRGFVAGFVRQHATGDELEGLLAVDGDVLAIVDYAETRAEVRGWLECAAAAQHPGRLRIVLIVRTLADWWQSLLNHSTTELCALLERDSPLLLDPEELSLEARARVFAEATAYLAAQEGVHSTAAAPPELAAPRFGKVLYLHMAALAAIEGRSTPLASLLAETLRHERRFWSRHLSESIGNDESRRVQHEIDLGVAALTLAGGARDEARAFDLLARAGVTEPLRRPLLTRFGDMYPGTGQPDAGDRYLSPIEPDLLAEAHVLAVLLDRTAPDDWIVRLFAGAPADALRPALQLLGRLTRADVEELTSTPAERRDAVIRAAVSGLIGSDLETRAPAAFTIAAALAERELRSPFAEVLHDNLRRAGTPALAAKLARRPYSQAIALRSIEAWIGETLVAAKLTDPTARFAALVRLGSVKLADEDYTAAHRQLSDAVVASRAALEQDDSAGWMHALGTGMLGLTEGESGDIDQAFATARESMRLCEEIEARAPDEHEGVCLVVRMMYALTLHYRGQSEEAVALVSALVPRFERLTIEHPEWLSMQALCDFHLGVCLAATDQHSDAATALRRAAERQRVLMKEHHGSELGNLARSLTFLGDSERVLGNLAGARQVQQDAVELWEELALAHPVAANSGLAHGMLGLANAALLAGDSEGARSAAARSVELLRELAARQPGPFTPQLILSLTILGMALVAPEEATAASVAFDEALELARPLAERSPALFKRLIARIYMFQGLRRTMNDDDDGAVTALTACLTIHRELADSAAANLPLEWAYSATILACILLAREQPAEAAAAITEALDWLGRVPSDAGPFQAFLHGWAHLTLASAYDELDDEQAAAKWFTACLEPLRNAAKTLPDANSLLLLALDQCASLLDDLDDHEGSEAKRREALALLRSLHGAGEPVGDDLAEALVALGLQRLMRDDPEGARGLLLEAESHLRARPVDDSYRRREQLLECLVALGNVEPDIDRRLERLREAAQLSLAQPSAHQRGLVRDLQRLVEVGESLAQIDHLDEALDVIQTAIASGQQAPGSVEMVVCLAEAYDALAGVFAMGDALEPCLAAMRACVENRRRLFANDPDAYRDDLAEALEQLHELLADAGLDGEAEQADAERRTLVALDHPSSN